MKLNSTFYFLKQLFIGKKEKTIKEENKKERLLNSEPLIIKTDKTLIPKKTNIKDDENLTRFSNEKEKDINISQTLRSEFHFLKFPFFDLCPRRSKRDEIEIKEIEETAKEKIEILWRVSRNIKSNLPSSFARRVHKEILEKILNNIKKPIPRLIKLGSLRQICKDIKINPSGGNCCEIKKALKDITAATIEAKGTFREKEKNGTKRFFEGIFHLYDMVFFTGETLPDGIEADAVYVLLNDMYIQNFNNNFVVPLDYQYLQSLRGDITSRMYEILNIWFYPALEHNKQYIEKKYSELCNYFPLTRQDQKWKAKKQLKRAHQQHTASGFLATEPEWLKTNQKDDWIIRYHIGPRAKEWYKKSNTLEHAEIKQIETPALQQNNILRKENPLEPPDNPLLTQLISLGITPRVAQELIKASSSEAIENWIKALKHTKPKDKAAYLVSAIKEGWELPEPIRKQKAKKEKEEKEKQEDAYYDFIDIQVQKHLNQMAKEELKKELKRHRKIFLEKYPFYKENIDPRRLRPYIENDYRKAKAKDIGLPSFDDWLSQRDNNQKNPVQKPSSL